MKKHDIIELIQIKMNGGVTTPDILKKAPPQVIEKYVSMAFNTLFYNLFRKDFSNLELYSKLYPSVAVTKSGNHYTSVMPIPPVQLPNKGDSIRDISYTDDMYDITFVPTTYLDYKRLVTVGTAGRMNLIGYNLNGNTIEYFGMNDNIEYVDLYLLRSFESFARNEDVPIPAGQDQAFIQMILGFMMTGDKIPDLNNNNNPL